MAKAEANMARDPAGKEPKGRKLGTVDTPAPRPGGDVAPLPPIGLAVVVVVVTVLVAGAGFGFFLDRHEPKPGWAFFFAGLLGLWAENRYLPGLRERFALRRARGEAKRLIKSVRAAVKKQKNWLGSTNQAQLDEARETLEKALPNHDLAAIEFATKKFDELADRLLTRKAPSREYAEQIGGAIIAALAIRAFFYEAFKIPSPSMVPTLLVGDHLFVNKFVYGLRIPFTVTKILAQVPNRGDIVVFNKPGDEDGDDIIKRVVGLPGDVVEVHNRRATINGVPLDTRVIGSVRFNYDGDTDKQTSDGDFGDYTAFEEKIGTHVHTALERDGHAQSEMFFNEGSWTVPPDHVFMMGDNRDNSSDSRFPQSVGGLGFVPIRYIKGRADIIWLSLGGPQGVRFGRFFSLLP